MKCRLCKLEREDMMETTGMCWECYTTLNKTVRDISMDNVNKIFSMEPLWVSFRDENGKNIHGFFEAEEKEKYLRIKTKQGNFMRIPWNRINKMKEVKSKSTERRKNKK